VSSIEKIPQGRYTKEFREEAARIVTENGMSVGDVSAHLSLPKSTLENWVRSAKSGKLGDVGKNRRPLTEVEAELGDQNIPLDPRRKILTHGQASVGMVTAILCQVFQMYRLCQFAEKSQILNIIFPDITSKEYFDDRMADTLDMIYDYGIGNLEMFKKYKIVSN
jgi:transposase-like protein